MEDDSKSSDLAPKLQAAIQLISALCDERIGADQFHLLESLVCTDAEIRALYVEMMHLHAGLHYFASAMCAIDPRLLQNLATESFDEPASVGMGETMVMPAMTDAAQLDEPDELPQPAPARVSANNSDGKKNPLLIKGGIAAIVTIGLGLLAYFLPSLGAPSLSKSGSPITRPPWYVATLSLTAEPIWSGSGMPQHSGSYVAGESLVLKSGVVQLELRHNGRLVVEGPADVRFINDAELRVNQGRVVATFPGGGLVVQCPTGRVTDLGTQFGVAVSPDGGTEVEVFEGRVSASRTVSSTASGTRPAKDLILTVGQAATISDKAVTPSPEGVVPQRFICNLQNVQVSSLDVADLISGGDGTTHRRHMAVDALSGTIGSLTPVTRRNGDHIYHRAHGFPVVDGAFIPDGTKGPMFVDSAGDKFQFPVTTNASVNYIWTGGTIPWSDDAGVISESGISHVLSGVDYSSKEHSIVCTHCNNAVTLDLDAVRRLYPDRVITRFSCNFGNSFINGWPGSLRINPVACVFLLVDGVSRYEKHSFTNQDGAIPVDVPIRGTDRFITLAATDDGKDIDRDWVLWTDAKFDVAPK
jgi:hypothetical protein